MYRVEPYSEVMTQIAALPDDALAGYAEALGVLASSWQAGLVRVLESVAKCILTPMWSSGYTTVSDNAFPRLHNSYSRPSRSRFPRWSS